MAPNKRKKKAGANSARGFATISVASKHQQNENQETQKENQRENTHTGEELSNPISSDLQHPPPKESEKPLHQLSAEQLEAHLEDSNLQTMIDLSGEKTKQSAVRHASKLQTEKRLLRIKIDLLNTQQSLPLKISQQVFDFVTLKPSAVEAKNAANPIYSTTPSDDELLVPSWHLYLLLLNLGFSEDHVGQALCSLLKHNAGREALTERHSGTAGLEFCLDFLAVELASEQQSDYMLPQKRPANSVVPELEQGGDSDQTDVSNLNIDSVPSHSPHIENHEGKASGRALASDQSDLPSNTTESEAEVSDLDSDMEPEHMIQKYIALKTRLFQIHPSFLKESKATKARSSRDVDHCQLKETATTKRLQAQIKTLCSDILFDSQRADNLWQSDYIDLLQQDAARKRHGRDGNLEGQSISTDDENVSETTDDPEAIIGDMFASIPDPASRSVEFNHETNDSNVRLRHFQSWNGVSPRRVLEDACKARDSSAELAFRCISQTSFACRHALVVHWSKPQAIRIVRVTDDISIQLSPRQLRFEMSTVACQSKAESEAFVSTVALFEIFSQSPKEEKAYLRLPSVWRDFWVEMSQALKEKEDASDRTTLRRLSQIISDSSPAPLAQDAEIHPTSTNGATSVSIDHLYPVTRKASPKQISNSWADKISTPSYQRMVAPRRALPISQYQHNILNAVKDNQVVIVCGSTGCGKSTQVPAYIMEHELSQGRPCKIYCTEPRRISAISLARRVSEELGEKRNEVGTLRSLVGFAVRLDSRVNEQTRLVYATTGIVMRMLESTDGLNEVTHLILDEVHERSIESDFLLIVLRKLMKRRPSLKVVLMSATVDAQKFSTYLGQAPIFDVPGRTFPVQVQYLEDAIEQTSYQLNNQRGASREDEEADLDNDEDTAPATKTVDLSKYSAQTRSTIAKLNEYRVPYDLIVRLLEYIQSSDLSSYSKAILIFLPGIAEIRGLRNTLLGHPAFIGKFEIFALHSSIGTEDQEHAFLPPPKGKRKVVLATNIAETGITIPDVTCVIDTGKHKEMRFDERRQLSRLIAAFISQANAVQRRGRAGRVQNGLCFHLFSRQRFEQMAKEQTPEMLRLSLQDLVLRVKICGLGKIEETLSEALDPPSSKNIRRAIDALQDVKALTPTQELTTLGRQLARLPLDVFLGKLLILGSIFRCLDSAITIAAILSSKSPFGATVGSRSQTDQAKLSFKRSDSDLLTTYSAYAGWRRVCNTTGASEQNFCRKHSLSLQTLSNIEELKGQLLTSLVDAGFLTSESDRPSNLIKSHYSRGQRNFVEVPSKFTMNDANDLVINSIIATAFYPKLLRREGKGWRNVATNQTISIHPSSVNKSPENKPRWLSFYHVMASGSKHYNAHETNAADDLAIILLCGEADFKMYAGVIVIDNNRIKFVIQDWRTMIVLKVMRTQLRAIIEAQIRCPGSALTERQEFFLDVFRQVFTREEKHGIVIR